MRKKLTHHRFRDTSFSHKLAGSLDEGATLELSIRFEQDRMIPEFIVTQLPTDTRPIKTKRRRTLANAIQDYNRFRTKEETP